jgi:hypothetical protein
MKHLYTFGPVPGYLLVIFQIILMLCMSDILEMLNLLKNRTITFVPASTFNKIYHVDEHKCFYRLLINITIIPMGLTNSLVLESLWKFPFGWLSGGVVTAIMFNCCLCLRKIKPNVFSIENDVIKLHECIYDHRRLIFSALAWSLLVFFVLIYIMVDLYFLYLKISM